MPPLRRVIALLVALTLSCAGEGEDGGATENASATSGATTGEPPPDTSATGDHGPDCAGIDAEVGTRAVAHRSGDGVRLEASRMPITCASTAESLCSGNTCYGYGIDTLNFQASLGVGSHDMKALADGGTGSLFCSSCNYVGICSIGGFPDAPGTLVIEEITETRIRGCVRASADGCFDVAFDVEFC
ncbi:MAG: hypothetical protein KC486_15940 [Myxococcales bacterium]|nr:hypothetical protein [Myxococcales bacterium]